MTERLSSLLHDEARAVVVPLVPVRDVLALGRKARRRRRAAVVASSAAAVVALGGGALLISSQPEKVDQHWADAYRAQGALAVDDELYVAGRHVPFEGAIKSLYYTADGVVVRSGTSPRTDDEDVDRYTLVRGDGSQTVLDLAFRDRVVATEPDSSHVAYAEATADGRWAVGIIDVGSGEEVGRTVVGRRYSWSPRGRSEAPAVALDGDVVWARFDEGWTEVDWRSGVVRRLRAATGVGLIADGRYAEQDGNRWLIRSMADGSVVSTVDVGRNSDASLSPDGRHLRIFDPMGGFGGGDELEPFLYDVRTEERADAPRAESLGWTPSGDVLSVADDGTVSTCTVAGDCTSAGLDVELTDYSRIKLGGNSWDGHRLDLGVMHLP
jgi:hypothetical protein